MPVKQRKELHPAWIGWFVAVASLPALIGLAVFVANLQPEVEWYQAACISYVVLMGGACLATLIYFDSESVPLFRPREPTAEERARDALDREFPG